MGNKVEIHNKVGKFLGNKPEAKYYLEMVLKKEYTKIVFVTHNHLTAWQLPKQLQIIKKAEANGTG